MGLDKDLGTIEGGELVDILANDMDPSKDISVSCNEENIKELMKERKPWVDKLSCAESTCCSVRT